MSKRGYNLPDDTGPNDPDAPWNQSVEDDGRTCIVCGRTAEYTLADEDYCFRCAPPQAERQP